MESGVGKGSTFSFTLARQEDVVIAHRSPGKTILVCDEDEATRELMARDLEAHGYHVVTFAGGADLLVCAEGYGADAVVLDLFMKELSGWETLARLKENPKTASLPVVIASVVSPNADALAEVDGWIQKPFTDDGIVSAIERMFRSPHGAARVLVVEDDADLARVIASSFERHGVEVLCAANGREAIELAQQIVPDLLVLDLVLPDMHGFGLVDWLKDHDLLRSVPVVVYSALETTPSQRERLRLGPTEFLVKSRISPDEFEQRVISLLHNITREGVVANVA